MQQVYTNALLQYHQALAIWGNEMYQDIKEALETRGATLSNNLTFIDSEGNEGVVDIVYSDYTLTVELKYHVTHFGSQLKNVVILRYNINLSRKG